MYILYGFTSKNFNFSEEKKVLADRLSFYSLLIKKNV